MPAAKTTRSQEHKRVANRLMRSSSRTAVKKAVSAIDSAKTDEATIAVAKAISLLDRASSKGIIHPNNAARRKSRLVKKLHSQQPS